MPAILVIGATGMVGQAVVEEAAKRGLDVLGAARSGADVDLDIADDAAVFGTVARLRPSHLINCAAIVSLDGCERDPAAAYRVNARAVAVLAEAAARSGARLVQISTDQYWIGDGDATHAEGAHVRLVNEYARTKFAGEAFALGYADALVVRTNVTGLRGDAGRPTFAEWAIDAIESGEEMTLFDDFFTSTIDAPSLARAVFDLLDRGASGLMHVASSQVASKQEFITALAGALGHADRGFGTASVSGLEPPRAASLGLDVTAAERALGRRLPDLGETISALVAQYREQG